MPIDNSPTEREFQNVAVGIEINREWAEVARERVRADVSGSD